MTPSVRVDIERHIVSVDGVEKDLAPKEFGIIVVLAKANGTVVSRKELLRKVWEYDAAQEIDSRTVDQHIARMRRKLGRAGDIIHTQTGAGYKLTAPVEIAQDFPLVGRIADIKRTFGKKPGARVTLDFDDLLASHEKGAVLRLA